MIKHEALAQRKPYQGACTKIWNAAQKRGVRLHHALGFFTALDWLQIAEGEITEGALDTVMRDIAKRDELQERLDTEGSKIARHPQSQPDIGKLQ